MTRREWLQLSASSLLPATFFRGLVLADDKPPSPDEMIHRYLATEVKRLDTRFMDGARTKDQWEKVRPRLARELLEMLGLDPVPEKTPLKAAVTGSFERNGIRIEKVHFQSRPGLYVTGNLYLPRTAADQKHPAILYVCGHSNRGRDGNKTAYQDHGQWFATNGYVCLTIDTLQLGEVAGIHHGTYREQRWWWHDRGYTPAGVECWNGIRAIDYLLSRPEVDSEKIGVTGISGGGATTCWIAATDDRVKVAVPVSGMSDLECHVTDKVINGHCDCMYPVNTYQWELTTILALFAPKPLLFVNSDMDPIFPMSGNRRIAERLRKCYAILGAKDHFDDYVSKGGHEYRPDLRLAVYGFFQKHLKRDEAKIVDADFTKIDGKDLRVFPTDADLPKDAINAKADELFMPVAKVELPTAKDFKEWKARLVKLLREKSFRALPEKVPAAEAVEKSPVLLRTEPGIEILGVEILIRQQARPGPRETIAIQNPDEEFLKPDYSPEILKYTGQSGVYIMPRGGGPLMWTRKNPPNTVERSFPLIGQTVDSGRVRDVAAAVARSGTRTRLVGRGPAGVLAAYAALFVPGVVDEVVIADPPLSHREGPHFLNVLRVLDIPEALGLLAPDVKLTLVGKNAKDKAFDKTAAIYELAGAKEKFVRE